MNAHYVCIAPMLDWTDRHARYWLRLISPHVRLYSEMVTVNAVLHGDRYRHLAFDPAEHPLAIQLGGSDPATLAHAAQIAADWGYDEINLNVGCPSNRVQEGRFGACLMAEPQRVADCIAAMCDAVSVPVTIKTRIGIDDRDQYDHLAHFVDCTATHGCTTFIIHARKAWLTGLSPKQNREIPPLRYDVVYQLKTDFPHLTIILNGGLTTTAQMQESLSRVDGIMIGRAAYQNPYLLAAIERELFQTERVLTRHQVVAAYLPYVEAQLQRGTPLSVMIRPLFGLFNGFVGARRWRRYLTEHSHSVAAGSAVIQAALRLVNSNSPESLPL